MSWKDWKQQKNSLDYSEESKADWNYKKSQLENLHEKTIEIQEAVALVKIYDRNAMLKIIPMIEVTFGIIKYPLEQNFKHHYLEFNTALKLAKHFKLQVNKWIYSQNNKLTNDVTNYISSIEYLYDCLNSATYSMGLGITFNKPITNREKIERALE
jgi:hypothetical protein